MRVSRHVDVAASAVLLRTAGVAIPVAMAEAATGSTVHIGSCTTEGQFVSCSVQGDVSKPKTIGVRATSSPRQRLPINWQVDCETTNSFQDRSGQFTLSAGPRAVSRNFRLPPNHARARCTATVIASTNSHGRFTMFISATR